MTAKDANFSCVSVILAPSKVNRGTTIVTEVQECVINGDSRLTASKSTKRVPDSSSPSQSEGDTTDVADNLKQDVDTEPASEDDDRITGRNIRRVGAVLNLASEVRTTHSHDLGNIINSASH